MSKLIKVAIIAIALLCSAQSTQGQVILSILFGDKLNSDGLEFGLSAGFNRSNIRGISESKGMNNWELGFYFDIRLKKETPWYVGTGVYVKSNVGGTNIPLDYPGNREINDTVYWEFVNYDGRVEKRFNTFYVPVNLRYLSNFGIFVDVGAQLGLVFKTFDTYYAEVNDFPLAYEIKKGVNKNRLYKWFDGGVNGGIGYKFKKGIGMKVAVYYYVGLTNIYKNDLGYKAYNSSLYVLANIPIGKKKAEKRRAEEAAAEGK
jgi:hypothetical protein